MPDKNIVQCTDRCSSKRLNAIAVDDDQVGLYLFNIVGKARNCFRQYVIHTVTGILIDEFVNVPEVCFFHFLTGVAILGEHMHPCYEDMQFKVFIIPQTIHQRL